MSTPRERTEQLEREVLSPRAVLASETKGRDREEAPDVIRTVFQRDRDRILHSKAFRRLRHKTQVFLAPQGDHYRVRLTHTLDVSQIARTCARALRLNEDLTEAIALGHDLGHTPFGHLGEQALTPFLGRPFRHNEQSLRIVEHLENGGAGLNLTWEVRDGIVHHPWSAPPPSTLEAQLVRFADRIAYINHDIDDAVRAGILDERALPAAAVAALGRTSSQRINTMVTDAVLRTLEGGLGEVRMSDEVLNATLTLRSFLFDAVYENPRATAEFEKAAGILGGLWDKLRARPELYLDRTTLDSEGLDAAARDFLAGMTDRYAVALFEEFFVPRSWSV